MGSLHRTGGKMQAHAEKKGKGQVAGQPEGCRPVVHVAFGQTQVFGQVPFAPARDRAILPHDLLEATRYCAGQSWASYVRTVRTELDKFAAIRRGRLRTPQPGVYPTTCKQRLSSSSGDTVVRTPPSDMQASQITMTGWPIGELPRFISKPAPINR